ncbi:TIR domain-containing protein [Streptomyces ipomoeae]|nr:TIR domain-containing protein [Streptomyces ipomoeae]
MGILVTGTMAMWARGTSMRIFISWSGDASRRCAEVLRDWLPYMNPAIEPFVSSQDISKGERGLAKIANKLQDCMYGIVCVTRDNQHAPWINFESGALSKELGETRLAPFLVDLAVKDLSGPISQFQATEGSSRDEVWALVKSLNDKCEMTVEQDRLAVTFERFWGDLEEKLDAIRSEQMPTAVPEREMPEILNELVALVRDQAKRMSSLEESLAGLQAGNNISIPGSASASSYGGGGSAPSYGSQQQMSPTMSQPMAPVWPQAPSPMGKSPSMRGFLIDEDDN